MKRECFKLLEEGRRPHRKPVKTPHYKELNRLVAKLGLDTKDFTNVDAVTPKLLAEWKGPLSEAHNFITLLEYNRKLQA